MQQTGAHPAVRDNGVMFGRGVKQPQEPADDYVISDATLSALDHGIGELWFEGVLKGHLASVVGEIRFPFKGPWPWFLVIWFDGTREQPFEDYGPGWYAVRELDAGYLDFHEPSVGREKVIFGRTFYSKTTGPDRRYDFVRLAPDEAARKWDELSLSDSDF
jgi:hypothetical protein